MNITQESEELHKIKIEELYDRMYKYYEKYEECLKQLNKLTDEHKNRTSKITGK